MLTPQVYLRATTQAHPTGFDVGKRIVVSRFAGHYDDASVFVDPCAVVLGV